MRSLVEHNRRGGEPWNKPRPKPVEEEVGTVPGKVFVKASSQSDQDHAHFLVDYKAVDPHFGIY